MDSGTSCLILPSQLYSEFQSQFQTQGGDCSRGMCVGMCDGDGLPSITFGINDNQYQIDPPEYWSGSGSGGACAACVQDGGNQMLLGDVFHRKFAVTYDFDNQKIGLPGITPSSSWFSGWGQYDTYTLVFFCIAFSCGIFRCYMRKLCCFSRARPNPALRQQLFVPGQQYA